jgi:hypothetical protein
VARRTVHCRHVVDHEGEGGKDIDGTAIGIKRPAVQEGRTGDFKADFIVGHGDRTPDALLVDGLKLAVSE